MEESKNTKIAMTSDTEAESHPTHPETTVEVEIHNMGGMDSESQPTDPEPTVKIEMKNMGKSVSESQPTDLELKPGNEPDHSPTQPPVTRKRKKMFATAVPPPWPSISTPPELTPITEVADYNYDSSDDEAPREYRPKRVEEPKPGTSAQMQQEFQLHQTLMTVHELAASGKISVEIEKTLDQDPPQDPESSTSSPKKKTRRFSLHTVSFLDFEGVVVMNKWKEHQLQDCSKWRVMTTVYSQVAYYTLELGLLLTLMVCVSNHEYPLGEILPTIFLCILTGLWGVQLKMSTQRQMNSPYRFLSNKIIGFFKAFFHLLQPFKYLRSSYNRETKLKILTVECNTEQVVGSEDFLTLFSINREEFVDAQDELRDVFLRRVFITAFQAYYLALAHRTWMACTMAYGIRCLIIILNVIAIIHATNEFLWKKSVFLHSLHVLGYRITGGRYNIPAQDQSCVSVTLKFLIFVTQFLSRFGLVLSCFQQGWGVGLFCMLFLFSFQLLFSFCCDQTAPVAENLPWGINTTCLYLLGIWEQAFVGIIGRWHRFSPSSIPIRESRYRIPYFLYQILTYGLTFFLMFCWVKIIGTPYKSQREDDEIAKWTYNMSHIQWTCRHPDSDATVWPAYFLSQAFWKIIIRFNLISVKLGESFGWILNLHCIFAFLHLIFNSLFCFYLSVTGKEQGDEDRLPPHVTVALYKNIFKRIFRKDSLQEQVMLLVRCMFVIATDNILFEHLYSEYTREDVMEAEVKSKWFETRVVEVIQCFDPGNNRYRDYKTTRPPDMEHFPLRAELEAAMMIMEHLAYQCRLHQYFVYKLDRAIRGMTSWRLEAIMDMMDVSRQEMLRELVNQSGEDSEEMFAYFLLS